MVAQATKSSENIEAIAAEDISDTAERSEINVILPNIFIRYSVAGNASMTRKETCISIAFNIFIKLDIDYQTHQVKQI